MLIYVFWQISTHHFKLWADSFCACCFCSASPPPSRSPTRILTTTWLRNHARTLGATTDAPDTGGKNINGSGHWNVRIDVINVGQHFRSFSGQQERTRRNQWYTDPDLLLLLIQNHLQDSLQAGRQDRLPQTLPVLPGLLWEPRQMRS